MSEILLSIIIPTLNRRKYIIESLSQALDQAREFADVEAIVVDNDSMDGTKEAVTTLIASLPSSLASRCKYVVEREKGSNRSRNRGRAEASGKILALLDDDAVIHENWIARIREHFLQQKSDCLAGRIELRFDSPVPNWFPPDFGWILGKSEYGNESRPLQKGEYPQSNNCAFTAAMFDALGGFNPNALIYGDETEFFRRAEAKNFSMFYRYDIAADHCVPEERLSETGLMNKARMWGKGSAYYWLTGERTSLQRVGRICEFAGRTGYIGLKQWMLPTFLRTYTYNFNLAHTKQLIKGS